MALQAFHCLPHSGFINTVGRYSVEHFGRMIRQSQGKRTKYADTHPSAQEDSNHDSSISEDSQKVHRNLLQNINVICGRMDS
jgi:hypothetical protein